MSCGLTFTMLSKNKISLTSAEQKKITCEKSTEHSISREQLVGFWSKSVFNPLMLTAARKQPDNFDEISKVKAQLGKYLKGKCKKESWQHLSSKCFVKLFPIFK